MASSPEAPDVEEFKVVVQKAPDELPKVMMHETAEKKAATQKESFNMAAKRRMSVRAAAASNEWVQAFYDDVSDDKLSKGVLWVKKGSQLLRNYLYQKEVSPLGAWFKYFDTNFNGLIEKGEFFASIETLSYPGSATELWHELDFEQTGVISLRDISEPEGLVWNDFRKWCGATFTSAKDMLARLLGVQLETDFQMEKQKQRTFIFGIKVPTNKSSIVAPASKASKNDTALLIGIKEWTDGLRAQGWDGEHEELLFHALDRHSEGCLGQRNLWWLEGEIRRYALKCQAKERSSQDQKLKAAARINRQRALNGFKQFLKKNFGPTYHAWRRALDLDGSMNLQRAELFKVCRQLGWKGDVRMLWQALDNDSAGTCSLEELDPSCARQLARLKRWAVETFGEKPVQAMWKAIDKRAKTRVSHEAFGRECHLMGFEISDKKMKELTYWLDWQCKKALTLEDIEFLDGWKPPAYLIAEPNPQAAEDIRKMMKDKYGHYLRAWRTVMDKDNSNTCNWYEFVAAMKHLRFYGDVAGAWLAFDSDLSGAISLGEVDPEANRMLIELKKWADAEFGGVRAAFKVLDRDKSGELTVQEFRHAVLLYGFSGAEVTLFKCLDANMQGRLQLTEVNFLDSWEVYDDDGEHVGLQDEQSRRGKSTSGQASSIASVNDSMYEYATEGPGPGAYDIASTFGAKPMNPIARHQGGWSFCRRPEPAWMSKLVSVGPSCCDATADPARKKPAWSFGRGRRPLHRRVRTPGPGHYDQSTPEQEFHGPKFTFGSRRGSTLHPHEQAAPGRKLKPSHGRPSSVCF
eukprot:TRINITY_DN14351_c0_g2_i1.p1 TRINITY_DN14351_c0_g2~~TRINITY_DN14351_c0_g2_i1.p1  ORF type:complete len:803 (-),score=174.13 TRINITY_DN14351_c0_g2_i1:52-2460(-)